MADDESTQVEGAEGKNGPGLLVWAALGLVAAGGGFAVPFFLPGGKAEPSASANAVPPGMRPRFPDEVSFLPFGDLTVNLDDGRMSRYLRLSFSLQVAKPDQPAVAKLVEEKQAILRNWLLSHLSDKGMDDIRGAAGQNRLRREIQDQFNSVLFPDGYDRVSDVLFQEFNVQ